LNATAVGLRIGLFELASFDDRFGSSVCGAHGRVYYRSTERRVNTTKARQVLDPTRSFNGMKGR